MVKIGGVTVAKDGKILWGTLFTVLFSAPVYAYQNGVIGTMAAWSRGVGDAVAGAREFVVRFIDVLLGGLASSLRTGQDTFIAAFTDTVVSVRVPLGVSRAFPGATSRTSPMELDLGVFTFAVAVVVALVSVFAFVRALRWAWGGLSG